MMMMIPLGLLLALSPASPCAGPGAFVLVDTTRRALTLCEGGQGKATFAVALGRGGVGKKVEGDAKVPLGEYPLARAVPSKAYHLFLPVGYPTAAQRRRGFTGSAIGVHGPPRGVSGPASTSTDWTLGCIAVGTDAEIKRVADWLESSGARRIVIRED